MDKLAVELVTLIAYFACTDGGQTGAALSLVSKHIHHATRPARFYSVSLIHSAAQVEHFVQSYKAELDRSTDAVPRVRHLCLSFFGQSIDASASPPAAPAAPPAFKPPSTREEFLAQQQQRAQRMRATQTRMDDQYVRVVPELIRLVAPTLESFACAQAQWRSSAIIDVVFPCLGEMTLVGGDPAFLPFSMVSADRPRYPALRRLHHIPSLLNKQVDFFQWAVHAPNLTHLRVSRMGAHPEITVDTLVKVMGPNAPENVFPHMRQIVVQPQPSPPSAASGPPGAVERAFDALCDRLRVAVRGARVPTVLFKPMVVPEGTPATNPSKGCVRKLQNEWMTRIEGGEGCWNSVIGESTIDRCWRSPVMEVGLAQ
ncbi:uncharacterized protein BXZ73DRAFT_47127 [Epithele typhae]|uniref:uncharacterized protein n=1 Tax=Epithele typhae TaxID=378194 RepID=UPI0020088004|nr:uncharacterized protein BXZ73DRAFT_47127 [Epithele typhae]KAH9931725.1 hypothetical protein BXZ73DRAFT_47127 [Epithele typhae]